MKKGEPEISVGTPVVGLMLNTVTALQPLSATYRNCPDGPNASPNGCALHSSSSTLMKKGEPAIGVSAPVTASALNTESVLEPWLVTNTNCPVAPTTIPKGWVPSSSSAWSLKGEPGIAVSAPVVALIENPEMLPVRWLVTYKNFPKGSTANCCGPGCCSSPCARAKGEPGTGVSAPLVVSMAYPETLLSERLAVYTYLPRGSTAIPRGPAPPAKGEPETGAIAPVVESMRNAETPLEPPLAT